MDHAAPKSPKIHSALRSLDGIAGEHIQNVPAWTRRLRGFCPCDRDLRHRPWLASHRDSTVDLLPAGPRRPGRLRRVWCQHPAHATYAMLVFDSRLRRQKAQTLSHATRYHPPIRWMSGPTIINWSMTPATCTISIKVHAAISFWSPGSVMRRGRWRIGRTSDRSRLDYSRALVRLRFDGYYHGRTSVSCCTSHSKSHYVRMEIRRFRPLHARLGRPHPRLCVRTSMSILID